MKKLLQFIVQNLVKHPESIKITQETGENNWVILNLSVHPEDMGKIIGKEGKIIKALRNVLRIKAIKSNIHFSLNLKEV